MMRNELYSRFEFSQDDRKQILVGEKINSEGIKLIKKDSILIEFLIDFHWFPPRRSFFSKSI